MQYPYLVVSDLHCHSWSSFSKPNPDGVNSRLQIILDELRRAHETLHEAGGRFSFYGGDLFHVRGKIEPSVFNPTFQAIRDMHQAHSMLMSTAIPGNHDLEGNDATELGNAMQQLSTISGFHVTTKPELWGDVLVVPWIKDLNHLRQVLADFSIPDRSKVDAIIHAPVNGVIKGIPDHGLEASELAALGFRRVFAGHYHDHRVFEDGKVISIGATSHQTWSDPGTRAGFLLVYEDRVEHHESLAPKFIDLDPATVLDAEGDRGEDIDEMVKGNYVRLKLVDVEPREIRGWRKDLEEAGALGIQITEVKTASVTRSGASAKAAISLASSVQHYITEDLKPFLLDEVSREAMDVLVEAQA